MSRTSCISHPEGERLILIRKWQMEACNQDACAAALLNLFEYWHNIKLEQKSQAKVYNEVCIRHGENSTQIETLLQWHKSEQLEASLLNIYNKRRIQAAIELLESLKFISVHRNPNPRYAFDKTRHFLFHPNEVSLWLQRYLLKHDLAVSIDEVNLHPSIVPNCANGEYKNDPSSAQNVSTITTNLPQQYTKNTYQDYLPKLQQKTPCADVASSSMFDLFWDKWISTTHKPLNKRRSFEIFTTLIKGENYSLLDKILDALDRQGEEKKLRQKFNLFIPQWPNPPTWLNEARWEDEVCLDEEFYRSEQIKTHSSDAQQKQLIKQQREEYLDVQYQSRLARSQNERSIHISNRQDAIRQFDKEFRNRK